MGSTTLLLWLIFIKQQVDASFYPWGPIRAASSAGCLSVGGLTQLLHTAAHPWTELSGKVRGAGDSFRDLRELLCSEHGEMNSVDVGKGGKRRKLPGTREWLPQSSWSCACCWRRLVLEFGVISFLFPHCSRHPEVKLRPLEIFGELTTADFAEGLFKSLGDPPILCPWCVETHVGIAEPLQEVLLMQI